MDKSELIKVIVIIVVILAIVFMSQQSFFDPIGKKVFSWGTEKVNSYWFGASDWFKTNIYPRITGEVEKRGEPLKEEVITQKDNAAKTIWEKIKNYFAEKFSRISGTEVE